MYRKHFRLIADALKASRPEKDTVLNYLDAIIQFEVTVFSIAEVLATTNPRFDYQKFVKAAGVEPRKAVVA